MICPNCGHDNLPGAEECSSCLQDLTQLDRPTAQDRVERSLMEDTVRALKPTKPVTIRPDLSMAEAIQMLLNHNLGAILVVDDDGKLSGILSERDILIRVAGLHADYATRPVRDFMTAKPEAVTADDTLAFAVHKMDVGGYRHLPVLADGKPTGIFSARDMMRHITKLCKEI